MLKSLNNVLACGRFQSRIPSHKDNFIHYGILIYLLTYLFIFVLFNDALGNCWPLKDIVPWCKLRNNSNHAHINMVTIYFKGGMRFCLFHLFLFVLKERVK